VLVCWGIGTALAGGIPVVKASGAVGLALGIALYVYLWRATPKARYFVYCRIDSAGLHHIEGKDPADRMAHFDWNEIERVEASRPGDDFRGIVLYLRRTGMRGVPLYLTMEHGAETAAAAISAHLAACAP